MKELADDDGALKSSIRELAIGAVNRSNAGIKVFATGGLGGVHHGAAENFDESADL